MNFDIDAAIFAGFLAFNVAIGLYYGQNVKNIIDYAIGDRNFSTPVLVATVVATYASGSGFLITISKTYSNGLYYLIASLFMSAQFIVAAFLIVPRMKKFLGKISVAETMGELYGNNIRIIMAIAGTIGSVGSIAVQFKACGNIFAYFLEIPIDVAIISAGVIVTIYSSFGGVKSVTFTDAFQFLSFGIAIPLVGVIIWSELIFTDGFSLSKALSTPKFDIYNVLDLRNPEFLEMIPLLLYFAIPSLKPAFTQRILIGRDIEQVKKAFLIAAAILVVIKLMIAWIPFLVFNVDSSLTQSELLAYIIDKYTLGIGTKGLLVVCVVAMSMSTADSYINSSSVSFAHDLCVPVGIKFDELLLSKIFSAILGIFGICLAIYGKDLLSIILATNSFYMPIVTVPLMATIFGLRTSKDCVLIGMAAGFVSVVLWKIIGIEMDCIVIAMLVNAAFLLTSHYLLKQDQKKHFKRNKKHYKPFKKKFYKKRSVN